MDVFEYLPQLIVAYDGNDEFANLIHVKKANKDNNYFCPCCGGNVRPRALDSSKEQSHYYHITGKCTKESQLHFFCKNWLFETGSKFYIDDKLFVVESIEIEKPYETPFGKYIPDVTVHTTTGIDIYFEMFFANRKTGDDYFCKWDYLKNDVVEVNIKEYMFKTDKSAIPSFTYLYHSGICYSKPYIKRDLYANTIAKIKKELTRQNLLNYKARIEQLDWFWQEIRNNKSKEEILNIVSIMEYDDMVSCYNIAKRKQCVSYLKLDILNMINQKVVSEVREELDLPYDENVYFDLKLIKGRTYKAGIRLNIKTDHIIYDEVFDSLGRWDKFDSLKGFPKIVFSKIIFKRDEIVITNIDIDQLLRVYKNASKVKKKIIAYEEQLLDFEENTQYKIRMNNDSYTIITTISDGHYETLLDSCYIPGMNLEKLKLEIEKKEKEKNDKRMMDVILGDQTCQSLIEELNCNRDLKCFVDFEYDDRAYVVLNIGNTSRRYYLEEITIDEFKETMLKCKDDLNNFIKRYNIISHLVEEINSCNNKFWTAKLSMHFDEIRVKIDQNKINGTTYENCYFPFCSDCSDDIVKSQFINIMHKVMKNMEYYGYRVMEV